MPEGFYISAANPNAEQGGGDLITPTHQTVDARGPWVVFPNVDVAEAQGQLPLPHAALPLSTIQDIVREFAATGIQEDLTAGEGDIRDKITKPADETVAWEDIPAEDQGALQAQFPKGGRTRTVYGVTTIPAEGNQIAKGPGLLSDRAPAPVADVLADEAALATLVQETPDEKGGYSPVDEDEGLDI